MGLSLFYYSSGREWIFSVCFFLTSTALKRVSVLQGEVCPKTFSTPELPIPHSHHSQRYLTAANIC
jgi:hypothetical protein